MSHPAPTYTPPPDQGLAMLYSDEHLVVVDKPHGLLSVPGRGEGRQDCLVSRVQRQIPDALIVHRLDMDTSGLLVLARGAEAHRRLSKLFRDRRVEKCYIAIVDGRVEPESGRIDLPLIADWPNRPLQKVDRALGKASQTDFRVLAYDPERDTSRVELTPITGRSHQLRVHLLAIGHPIAGDPLYGSPASRAKASRLLLHADYLAFPHPFDSTPLSFRAGPRF